MTSYIFNFLTENFLVRKKFFEPLCVLNNIRFDYILKRVNIKDKLILDIGCGDGLLTEKICIHGGIVTGIDKSRVLIDLAVKNALAKNMNIKYVLGDLFSINFNHKFDIIICTEVLEHLCNKEELFSVLLNLSKSGTLIFLSSLESSLLSYFKVIFFGEFILNRIVKNSHKFDFFLNVFDLNFNFKKNNFVLSDIKYLNYDFFLNYSSLCMKHNINYLIEIFKK